MPERGLLLAEDEAMKAKLSNITVPNPKAAGGQERVRVYYRMPTSERDRVYPFITIDLVDIEFAADRAHSAQITPIDYWPSEFATFVDYAAANGIEFDPENQRAQATWWHPYNIHYQVATHTRSAQQDRVLTSKLLGTSYLPHRWGYLHVPADDSQRWLDRVGSSQSDYLEGPPGQQDRVFRRIYNVAVTADVPPEDPFIFRTVMRVHGVLHGIGETGLTEEWARTGLMGPTIAPTSVAHTPSVSS